MKKQIHWDLSDLYKDIDDSHIDLDLKKAKILTSLFVKKYKGKIENSTPAKKLVTAIKEYEEILEKLDKILSFANLVFAADSKNPKHGAFLQKTKTVYTDIAQQLIFFELEIIRLEKSVLKKLIGNPQLDNYKHYLKRVLEFAPHRLSEAEEKVITNKSLTGRSAFIRLFNEELAGKKFKLITNKREILITEAEVLSLLYDKNRQKRRLAADSLTQGLREELRRFTFISNTLVQDKSINDKLFKYSYPEESRHKENEIYKRVVDTMIDVVAKNYKIVQDHYKFKTRVLGIKKLYDYDRYAPVIQTKSKVNYKDSQKIILESFTNFSPQYANAAEAFFENNWIDVYPQDGKQGGAFCHYGLPAGHPYIFLNYTNNINDCLTLAHELGHGIHAYLFKKQPYLNFDTPLTIAETASVFGEMLVFDNLARKVKGQEKFALYINKVEGIFATVFRQTAMFKFERDFHNAYREKGELTHQEIGNFWMQRQKEMFGASVTLRPNYGIWWSYIPHFLHTPFYVYAYAFGELLTLSLYAKYKKEGKTFVDKYMEMLSFGGSKSPDELLKPLGVNLKDPNFWQEGIDFIKKLTQETRALYA